MTGIRINTMNNGVPNEIRKQSFNFEFNNNSFLKQYKIGKQKSCYYNTPNDHI